MEGKLTATNSQYNEILEDICVGKGSNKEIGERYGRTPSYINSIRKKVESMKYEPRIEDSRLVCYKCAVPAIGSPNFHLHHNHKNLKWIAVVCPKCNRELESEITFIPKKLDLSLNYGQIEAWRELMKEYNEKDLKGFILKFPKHYFNKRMKEACE